MVHGLLRWNRLVGLMGTTIVLVASGVPASFAADPPEVTDLSPARGAPGTKVTIAGRHFAKTGAVTFNGAGASFRVVSRTQLETTVPAGATTGPIEVTTPYGRGTSPGAFQVIPIEHMVIVFQENHTFDNVFGKFCDKVAQGRIVHDPCDGRTYGVLPNNRQIPLSRPPDIVPIVSHSVKSQLTAINGGAMNGFGKLKGCRREDARACYSVYDLDQIPNLINLAKHFTISDNMFESSWASSWASHLDLATALLDGFYGDAPKPSQHHKPAPGGGCDSFKGAAWIPPEGGDPIMVPSCVPDQNGFGPSARHRWSTSLRSWTGSTRPG